MLSDHFIPLRCSLPALEAIATSLAGFSLANVGADWLVTSAYLHTGAGLFIASAAIEVLKDGAIVRPMEISTAADLLGDIDEALPDIQRRADARGFAEALPDAPENLPDVGSPQDWSDEHYSTQVVIRNIERHGNLHCVACGILFRGDGDRQLLIGTDLSTIALVVSEDKPLIENYLEDCDTAGLNRYVELTA